jgi:CarD family transcriptional regulator
MADKSVKDSSKNAASPKRFKVGDLAVYPAHGVGRIEAIETKVVNGEEHDFYIMKVIENAMVIMIPTWNVESVGLRDVIQKKEIPKIFDVMRSRQEQPMDNQTWNRRYREYMEKIKTGSLFEVAEVYRDLSLLKTTKDLSFGERKLYDTAQNLLVKELSTAKNKTKRPLSKRSKRSSTPMRPEFFTDVQPAVVLHLPRGHAQAGTRLDVLLASEIDDCSRSFAATLIRQGCITVDGSVKKPGYAVKAGECVAERLPHPSRQASFRRTSPFTSSMRTLTCWW